jgi:hypothetical protein
VLIVALWRSLLLRLSCLANVSSYGLGYTLSLYLRVSFHRLRILLRFH